MSIGAFDIIEILGRGQYATVCLAQPRDGGDPVALKVLQRRHGLSPEAVSRLRDEARVLRSLHHPNIVGAHALLDYEGLPVITMEPLTGISLERALRHQPDGLPISVALQVAVQVASALDYAYGAPVGPQGRPIHVVHRDVNPANIVLTTSGGVKLIDFGIAKSLMAGRETKSVYLVPGNLGFASPERVEGAEDTPAVDVFALGLTLFSMLTGKPLIVPKRPDQHGPRVARQLSFLSPQGMSDASIQALRALITDMTHPNPSARIGWTPVLEQLVALIEQAPSNPTLPRWAHEHVGPAYRAKAERRDASAYDVSEMSFLETDTPHDDTNEVVIYDSAESRARLEALLAKPDWHKRAAELQRLIRRSQAVPTEPFLAVLRRANVPFWQVWRRAAAPGQLEQALLVLCDHPSQELAERATELCGYPSERVQSAARFVLNGIGAA